MIEGPNTQVRDGEDVLKQLTGFLEESTKSGYAIPDGSNPTEEHARESFVKALRLVEGVMATEDFQTLSRMYKLMAPYSTLHSAVVYHTKHSRPTSAQRFNLEGVVDGLVAELQQRLLQLFRGLKDQFKSESVKEPEAVKSRAESSNMGSKEGRHVCGDSFCAMRSLM